MPLKPKQEQPYYTLDDNLPIPPVGTNLVEYIAILNQTTTNNPVITIAKDDITGITITRAGTGQYEIEKTNSFNLINTTWYITTNVEPQTEGSLKMVWISSDKITIFTYNSSGVVADDVLNNTPIYIRQIPA